MRKPIPVRAFAAALLGGFLLAACQTPEQALLDSGQSQVKLRSIQTRSFDTTDKEKTLRTVIATMQDLNFVIDKADLTLGTVTATKLDRYMLRMTVSVRPRGQTQLLVRANANFGLKPVTEPEPYQKFFASLGKAMFLTAHEEGAGNEKEQAVEKTAPAAGADQQAGLAAPPAAAPEPPIPLAIAQPSVAATSPSSGIALPPAGYKPPPVGTKVTYDTWGYTVTKTEGVDITFKTTAGDWKHYYAVFGKHGEQMYSRQTSAGQPWETSLDDESKSALESFWPLEVGKKVKWNLEESAYGYSGQTSLRHWTVTLEIVGTEILELNGVHYPTYVVKEHAVSKSVKYGVAGYSETKWYNPESGLILKSVRDGFGGWKDWEYSLSRMRLP